MTIQTIDGKTKFINGGDLFTIVKLAGFLLVPSINNVDAGIPMIQLNILEAIIDDIITNKKIPNAIFGVNVLFLLPIMKDIKIMNCKGFKLWCILYFIWNMKFCKNKGFGIQESFAHNYPALICILKSFGYSHKEMIDSFINLRIGAISAIIIDKLEFKNENTH
jgi:hypothetical protein